MLLQAPCFTAGCHPNRGFDRAISNLRADENSSAGVPSAPAPNEVRARAVYCRPMNSLMRSSSDGGVSTGRVDGVFVTV